MKKKSNAGASASPTLRQHGQRSLLSSPLFSTTSGSVGTTRKPVSLSEFLDRKVGKSRAGDGGADVPVRVSRTDFASLEKKSRFSSIGFGSGRCNGLGIRRGVEESGDRRVLDESVFRQLNCAGKEEGGVVVVNSAREEETAELELLETDDVEGDSKKRGCPFGDNPGNYEWLSAPKYLVVLGDDPKPRQKRMRQNTVNRKQMPLYNHYANGSGWWDCDREGVDCEEVGCNETWEGMGSTTLGGLEWH